MGDRTLLVTGARVLAAPSPAQAAIKAWAWALLKPAVQWSTLVVTGDAQGPDDWAALAAEKLGVPCERWCLDGTLRGGKPGARWHPHAAHPLERNKAMVLDVAYASGLAGGEAKVLALLAPWSVTQGTMHTVSRARELKLAVDLYECPFAPEAHAHG